MFNEHKRLRWEIADLRRRIIDLEAQTNFYQYSQFGMTYKVGSVKDIITRILNYLGLYLEYVHETEGHAELKKFEREKK